VRGKYPGDKGWQEKNAMELVEHVGVLGRRLCALFERMVGGQRWVRRWASIELVLKAG